MAGQHSPWGRTNAVVGYRRFQTLPSRPFSAPGQRACAKDVIDLRKSSCARNSGDSAPPARDDLTCAAEKGGTGSVASIQPNALVLEPSKTEG